MYSNNTDRKFIIIGGGPAARYAAEAIRDRDETAAIQIFADEQELPYNRPMLTKILLEDMTGNRLAIDKFDWYMSRAIQLKLGTRVLSIDTAGKTITADDGTYPYDKLIYALGAHCFVVPIKGSDLDHVVTIRNIADCQKLAGMLSGTKKVVTIGGGVMGLEGAWEICKAGHDCTILETAPGLLPKQLDDEASSMLYDIVTGAGVKVVCGAKITEITSDAVILEDGTSYPADVVVMSTGMRGNIAIAQEAGIETDRLIVCDSGMRTSAPDVYACGDCAEVNGAPQAFLQQAAETGRVAGANAAGDDVTYDDIPASMYISAFRNEIFAMGSNGKDGREYEILDKGDSSAGTYRKLYFAGGKLAGVILVGDTSGMTDFVDALKRGAAASEFAD